MIPSRVSFNYQIDNTNSDLVTVYPYLEQTVIYRNLHNVQQRWLLLQGSWTVKPVKSPWNNTPVTSSFTKELNIFPTRTKKACDTLQLR